MRAGPRQGREIAQPPLDQRQLLVPPPTLDLAFENERILDVFAFLSPHHRDRTSPIDVATSVTERVLLGTDIEFSGAADVEGIIGAFQDVDPRHVSRIRIEATIERLPSHLWITGVTPADLGITGASLAHAPSLALRQAQGA